jgi:hypothetical protein
MRTGLDAALVLGSAGLLAVLGAEGCRELPECASDAEFMEAVREGTRADLLSCPVEPSCDPIKSSGPVDNSCGVFVSSSQGDDAENDGTKESPVRTVARALEILPTRAPPKTAASIYLCAEPIVEEVTLPSGVAVVGGLDCKAPAPVKWAFNSPNVETVLTAPEGKTPLRLTAGAGLTEVRDVHVVAMAVPDTMPGGSSIAVIADGAEALFERSLIEAGNGAKGADGEPYMEPATAGAPGLPGQEACTLDAAFPVEGPENQCAAASSFGGTSGAGGIISGTIGSPGEPGSNANGGSGETSMGAPCSDGAPGADGTSSGAGADAAGQGTIDSTAGYTGVSGGVGQRGAPGQGGGGGGGAKSEVNSVNQCPNIMSGYGASGGSGGAGGCGGVGGRGGGPGGSSIAVVSIRSKLTFSASTIKAGDGGAPGEGGPGQEGGAGGMGAPGGGVPVGVNLKPACAGGAGGKGGFGGLGGRGLGGHSIGVAFIDQNPAVVDGSRIDPLGNAGMGGLVAKTKVF